MAIERWEMLLSSRADSYLLKIRGPREDAERIVHAHSTVCGDIQEITDDVFQWAIFVVDAPLSERLAIQNLVMSITVDPSGRRASEELGNVLDGLSGALEGLTNLSDDEQAFLMKKMAQVQGSQGQVKGPLLPPDKPSPARPAGSPEKPKPPATVFPGGGAPQPLPQRSVPGAPTQNSAPAPMPIPMKAPPPPAQKPPVPPMGPGVSMPAKGLGIPKMPPVSPVPGTPIPAKSAGIPTPPLPPIKPPAPAIVRPVPPPPPMPAVPPPAQKPISPQVSVPPVMKPPPPPPPKPAAPPPPSAIPRTTQPPAAKPAPPPPPPAIPRTPQPPAAKPPPPPEPVEQEFSIDVGPGYHPATAPATPAPSGGDAEFTIELTHGFEELNQSKVADQNNLSPDIKPLAFSPEPNPESEKPVVTPFGPAVVDEEPAESKEGASPSQDEGTINIAFFFPPGCEPLRDKFIASLMELSQKKAKKPMTFNVVGAQPTTISPDHAVEWIWSSKANGADCFFVILPPSVSPESMESLVTESRQAGLRCFLVESSEVGSKLFYMNLLVELMMSKRKGR